MPSNHQQIIEQAYTAFNNRDIDGILQLMHADVHWPRAFKGGHVAGQEAVRAYWTQQWAEIDPHVTPTAFHERADGSLAVDVHQVVKDLQGALLMDGPVKHVYTFEDGLMREMIIEVE